MVLERQIRRVASLVVFALAACALPALADPPGRGDSAFQVRLGGYFPSGDSEFWEDTEDVFAFEASDLNDFVLGLTFVHSVNNHFEIGINADFFEGEAITEYRDFVDEDGFPILHDSRLSLVPLSVDARLVPGGRYKLRGAGRRVLQPVFYVGGGVGAMLWEYEEVGDFIDFGTDEIFFDQFEEDGVAFEVHALAGFELPVGRRTSVLVEGRYVWSDDEFEEDFGGLGQVDLGGAAAYGGLSFRF